MAPLIVLLGCWLIFALAGRLGIRWLDSGAKAGRAAFAVMFVFTGVTHFSPMKHDYLAMMPSPLPRNLGFIYVSGLLEITGGLGLLFPATQRLAGAGLILLLVAMFPANVTAALNEVSFRGEPPMSLWVRTPIQLAFVLSVWWSALRRSTVLRAPLDDQPGV